MAAAEAGYSARAAYYRTEYSERRDIAFLTSLVRPGDHVLEIPCGAGRLTLALAQVARRVTALDIEPAMVAEVRKALEGSPVESRVIAAVGDLVAPSASEPVDLLIVPREALQLLPPQAAGVALPRLCALLAPGGRIVVDLARFNPGQGALAPDPDYFDPGRHDGEWGTQWERRTPAGGRLQRTSRQWRTPDSLRFAFRYQLVLPGLEPEYWQADMTLFLHDAEFVRTHLGCHMQLVGVYGDYDRSAVTLSSSRNIVVAERRRGAGEVSA
jgi:SAM-dependent methyltransferase